MLVKKFNFIKMYSNIMGLFTSDIMTHGIITKLNRIRLVQEQQHKAASKLLHFIMCVFFYLARVLLLVAHSSQQLLGALGLLKKDGYCSTRVV